MSLQLYRHAHSPLKPLPLPRLPMSLFPSVPGVPPTLLTTTLYLAPTFAVALIMDSTTLYMDVDFNTSLNLPSTDTR